MATKEEVQQELNDILGVDLEFSDMKSDDLEHLHSLVKNGALIEPLMKHIVKTQGKSALEERVDNWYPGKIASRLL